MLNEDNSNINLSAMTEEELYEWRNSLDINSLGFSSEREGMKMSEEDDKNAEKSLNTKIANNSQISIQQNLTTTNFSNSNISRIKYIVIHYTANNGDTAYGNTSYFKSTYRGASAHYFVDENPTIWQCVLDEDVSWHCGGSLESSHHPYHNICTNSNSIGIELCSRKYSNGTYYFKDETINNAAWLTKMLMDKYGVSINNVIRHYDVTGKYCPRPFINENAWQDFKARVQNGGDGLTMSQYEELLAKINAQQATIDSLQQQIWSANTEINNNLAAINAVADYAGIRYNYVDNYMPEWARQTVQKLMDLGDLKGDDTGLELSYSNLRLFTIMDRMNVWDNCRLYNSVDEVPDWGKDTVQKLVDAGILKGDGDGLGVTEQTIKLLVYLDRLNMLNITDKEDK